MTFQQKTLLLFSENQCLEYETKIAKLEEDHETEISKLKQNYETEITKLEEDIAYLLEGGSTTRK